MSTYTTDGPPHYLNRSERHDMHEFLTDNVALLQQLQVFTDTSAASCLPGVARPRLQDVTSLSSWLYCFLAYAAITMQNPATRDHLTYARLVSGHPLLQADSHAWPAGNIKEGCYQYIGDQLCLTHTYQWSHRLNGPGALPPCGLTTYPPTCPAIQINPLTSISAKVLWKVFAMDLIGLQFNCTLIIETTHSHWQIPLL